MDRRRGREGWRGDYRPDPAPFPADDGTPLPPADDEHCRQLRAQNGQGGGYGAEREIANRMLGVGDHTPALRRGRMMAVGTSDVCSNAAVNSGLSCFLYTL